MKGGDATVRAKRNVYGLMANVLFLSLFLCLPIFGNFLGTSDSQAGNITFIGGSVTATVSDTSANYAGTGANYNDAGTTAWSNPTYIQGNVTSNAATCNVGSNGGTSQLLRASNFGFAIPAGATIVGVKVEVEQVAANNSRHRWNVVKLLKAGTETGDNRSDASSITTSKGYKTFGSNVDLWGATLTDTDVNNSGFGVSLKIQRYSSQSTTTSISNVRITVSYQQ